MGAVYDLLKIAAVTKIATLSSLFLQRYVNDYYMHYWSFAKWSRNGDEMIIAQRLIAVLLVWGIYVANAAACPLVAGLVDFNCDGKHRISAVGDSIVYGVGDEKNGNSGGYVLRLRRSFPSSQVFGFGYPGITTAKLLSYYKKQFKRNPKSDEITKLGTSDIVIIDVGRNDYFNRNSSTLTATTIKRLTEYLSTQLKKRFGTAPLFVVAVLPLTRRQIDLGFIKQVNMVMLRIRGSQLPAYLRFDTLKTTLLGPDRLHPTSAGYDVLAKIAAKYIKRDAQRRSKAARPDKDRDGIYDLFERLEFKTAPKRADTDGDGLLDGAEVFTYGTNPLSIDTDGDGIADAAEIAQGVDPLTPN